VTLLSPKSPHFANINIFYLGSDEDVDADIQSKISDCLSQISFNIQNNSDDIDKLAPISLKLKVCIQEFLV
jgi:hypothetical protein